MVSSKGRGQNNVSQIKSSEELGTITSSPEIKKTHTKLEEFHSPPNNKHNALEILQITDLKKQLRTSEGEIHQFKKTIFER